MISVQDLQLKNPWWFKKDYQIPEAEWPKRDMFSVVQKNLDHSLILNIVGLRRLGKSTIVKQLMADLLSHGIEANNIFYFLFDYSSQLQKADFLDQILALYLSDIKKTTVSLLTEKLYIFLDEIQYINDWQAVLKKYYDLSNQKIKFIVTGSQSMLLKGKARESLAGRIFDYYLPPLSFSEFLHINDLSLDHSLHVDLYNLPAIFSNLSHYQLQHQSDMASFSKEYIISGQFPESRKLGSLANQQEYIKESVLGKVLDDCIRIFKIDRTDEFKLIAYQLLNNSSSIFELKNISRDIALSRTTLEKYLIYLKDAYLLEILYKYHKSLIKQGRILKKVYTTCVNFLCALNHYRPDHLDEAPEAFGKIMENLIYNNLRQKYPEAHLSFFRKGEKEIDFLLSKDKKSLPIEVKYTNTVMLKDLKPMISFIQDKKVAYGTVVTKNILDKKIINGQTIYYLPYYFVLLI